MLALAQPLGYSFTAVEGTQVKRDVMTSQLNSERCCAPRWKPQ